MKNEAAATPVSRQAELAGPAAARLAAVEVGLGSLLHAFNVPLGGNFLSLNQAAFLAHATRTQDSELRPLERRLFPLWISQATALLKSLSPAGKKLTPMLAISVQGALFSVGTLLLGPNLLGVVLGAVLLSLWSFVQVALIGWLLLGSSALEILVRLAESLRSLASVDEFSLWRVLAIVVLVKAILAAAVATVAWRFPEFWRARVIDSKLARLSSPREVAQSTSGSPWRGGLRDLFRPLTLVAIALPITFFALSQRPWAEVVWISLRPLAIAYLGFVLLRTDWARRKLRAILGA